MGDSVAGLEAARAAALRGQRVVVFERHPVLGGRARLALRHRIDYQTVDLSQLAVPRIEAEQPYTELGIR